MKRSQFAGARVLAVRKEASASRLVVQPARCEASLVDAGAHRLSR
jgi:hypothetical protein